MFGLIDVFFILNFYIYRFEKLEKLEKSEDSNKKKTTNKYSRIFIFVSIYFHLLPNNILQQ